VLVPRPTYTTKRRRRNDGACKKETSSILFVAEFPPQVDKSKLLHYK